MLGHDETLGKILKEGIRKLIKLLRVLTNKCLEDRPSPKEWSEALYF